MQNSMVNGPLGTVRPNHANLDFLVNVWSLLSYISLLLLAVADPGEGPCIML